MFWVQPPLHVIDASTRNIHCACQDRIPNEHTCLVCLSVHSQLPVVWPQVNGSGQVPRIYPISEILLSCFSVLLKSHGPSFHFPDNRPQPLAPNSGHKNTCIQVWGPLPELSNPGGILSTAVTKTTELHLSSFCCQDWGVFPPLHLPECLVRKGTWGHNHTTESLKLF